MNLDLEIYEQNYLIEVTVTHYHHQKPVRNADNPSDFYGYTDCEFEVGSVFEELDTGEWQRVLCQEDILEDLGDKYLNKLVIEKVQEEIGNSEVESAADGFC